MKNVLFFLLMLLPMVVSAHDFEVNGIYYNIINENEVEITYKGSSVANKDYSGNVVIPESVTYDGVTYLVTAIGNMACAWCTDLMSVEIPNTVNQIGYEAFDHCSGLTSIVIPNSVTSIGFEAFINCTNLISIDIPNSVRDIGGGAFSSTAWFNNHPNGLVYAGLVAYKYKGVMPAETNIILTDGTLSIAGSAFKNCTGLSSIEIPSTVTSIGIGAFDGCNSLKNIVLPNSFTTIGEYAFDNCTGLTSIEIPNSVVTIGRCAFSQCVSLSSIVIPNSVTSIECYAFYGCNNLTNIEIPESVTSIDNNAFEGTAWYEHQPNGLVYAGFVAYRYKGDLSSATSISLIEGTVGIAEEAFSGCTSLRSIEIPNSVLHIGNNAFDNCNITTLILTGEGEWLGGTIGINNKYSYYHLVLYVDSRITSLKGINIQPSGGVYCYAQTPPACDDYTFNDYSGRLHIPANSLASYFTTEYWSNFVNIVGDAVELNEISLSQDYAEVNVGTQFNLTAILSPANATPNNIRWSSTNTSIATVNSNGIVTTVSVGECDITVQCLNKKAICHVVVKDTNVIITLDEQEINLLPNHIITLTPSASVMPDGFAVTSSEPTVAAARVVNNKIQVVGIKEGTTIISVGSTDGTAIPATCLVTVYTDPGDMDCDGFVNISDVTSLIDYLLNGDSSQISTKNADVDGDGIISISDITELIDKLLQGNA